MVVATQTAVTIVATRASTAAARFMAPLSLRIRLCAAVTVGARGTAPATFVGVQGALLRAPTDTIRAHGKRDRRTPRGEAHLSPSRGIPQKCDRQRRVG